LPGISTLETPFGGIWSGVVLVQGPQNILIDSGATAEIVDDCLMPALRHEGLELNNIDLLLNTHCHGDHIGGHYRIRELNSKIKIATYAGSYDKIRDPLKYSKLIRARFPEYSPLPPTVLKGIEPDLLLEDGGVVAGHLRLIHTPGHDDDSVCWYDMNTKTLICGDSLQFNGTSTQGIGFYQDLKAYRNTLRKLSEIPVNNIILGHPYNPCGAVAIGQEKAYAFLEECISLVDIYDEFIRNLVNEGENDPVVIAQRLIEHMGGKMPEYLFLALYTVTEHLKEATG